MDNDQVCSFRPWNGAALGIDPQSMTDCDYQFISGAGLVEEGGPAATKAFCGKIGVVVHREKDNLHRGHRKLDLFGCVESVHDGHPYVDDDQVWFQIGYGSNQSAAITNNKHDIKFGLKERFA